MEEAINKVLLDIKSKFSFMGMSDKEIYNKIKKVIGNKEKIELRIILQEVSDRYSTSLVKNLLKNNFEHMDVFFENKFVVGDNFAVNLESLKKLSDVIGNVNEIVAFEIYTKIIDRYDVLSKVVMEIYESCNCSFSVLEERVMDDDICNIVRIHNMYLSVDDSFVESRKKDNYNDKHRLLTKDEEVELTNHYYKYRDAETRERLILANMGLVNFAANSFLGKGFSYDELIQDGMIGLIKAVDKFNPELNYRFSSYAYQTIVRHMDRGINNNSRTIRIPIWRSDKLKQYNYKKNEFIREVGHEPTVEEMAEYLAMDLDYAKESEFLLTNYVDSLDFYIEDDDREMNVGNIFEDKKFIGPESYVFKNDLNETLVEILNSELTEQEKIVIVMAFGGYDGVEYNNSEIGRDIYKYGLYHKELSRERVRQLKSSALKKLRSSKVKRKLKMFL